MAEAAQKKSSTSNLTQRILTAVIAIPPVLLLIFLGGVPFGILIAAVGMFAVLEMYFMLRRRSVFFLLSLCYVIIPLACLLILRQTATGLVWMALIIAITWVTDTMAYIGGRLYGKTPLSPTISPNKTVEGAVIGYLSGCIATIIVLLASGFFSAGTILLALIGPVVTIGGDLFESYIKRQFHIKDSHLPGLNILPGHGGVMDRIDGLLFVCTFCFIFAIVVGLP
jgi:phosphatidate cytidylyltransferase